MQGIQKKVNRDKIKVKCKKKDSAPVKDKSSI